MPIITLTSGIYSNAESIAEVLAAQFGFQILSDNDILDTTERLFGIKPSVLKKVVESTPLIFNDLTHTREKCIALLKKAVCEHVTQGGYILHGLLGHLVPAQTTHVMKVLIIANKDNRNRTGIEMHGLSEKEVLKNINYADKTAILWTHNLLGKKAWDNSLYDIVLPTDKLPVKNACTLITEHFEKLSQIPQAVVESENRDFALTAEIELALSKIGEKLSVSVETGAVTVSIDKNVLMLSKLQQKITNLVREIDGVSSVECKVGRKYHKANIIHDLDFETPTRILLVDDEKEFVQTLSERLTMRQVENSYVFSGEEALGYADRNETDVMVLDLKMPGIDGFEVLKQIKKSNPEIEVIILTGHGSEKDQKTCLELGAFAYLQKPADIDILTTTMKEAYEKIRLKKEA